LGLVSRRHKRSGHDLKWQLQLLPSCELCKGQLLLLMMLRLQQDKAS
jgi:hypothetical protein